MKVKITAVIVALEKESNADALANQIKHQSCQYSELDVLITVVVNSDQLTHTGRSSIGSIVYPGKNLGYGGALNYMLQKDIEQKSCPNYYWLLNDDVSIESDGMAKILSEIQRCSSRVIGMSNIQTSGKTTLRMQYIPWMGYAFPTNRPLVSVNGYMHGSSLLIDGAFIQKAGGFSSNYFLYFEELQLVRLAGVENISLIKDPIIRHQGQQTSHSSKKAELFCTYHAALSCFIFTKQFHPRFLLSVKIFRVLGKIVQSIIQLNFDSRPTKAVLRAARDANSDGKPLHHSIADFDCH